MEQKLQHEKAVVLVPRPGSRLDREVAPGSGLVGVTHRNGTIVFYEGNLYGAMTLHQAEERVVCAFGRAATAYPTCAMSSLLPEEVFDVIRVGEISWPDKIGFDSPESKQLFDSYMSRYQGAPSTGQHGLGWYGGKIVEIEAHSFLGEYEEPRSQEEWKWLEAMASFAHVENDVAPGVFEFILRVRKEDDDRYEADPPPRLQAVLDMVKRSGADWVLFYQR